MFKLLHAFFAEKVFFYLKDLILDGFSFFMFHLHDGQDLEANEIEEFS
jgi:hypothetical protein